jgi:hypothetical protein
MKKTVKKFEAWCEVCNYFALHIEITKNNIVLIKCLECKTWTKIDLVESERAGSAGNPEGGGPGDAEKRRSLNENHENQNERFLGA